MTVLHNKIWAERKNDRELENQFSEKLKISKVTSRILLNRRIDSVEKAEKFLHPEIDGLYDPFKLQGMETAVARIRQAIDANEKICIYGDYDVDGITSITTMLKYFEQIGYEVDFYIPNRLEEGYGISKAGLDKIKDKQCTLVISVDTGITAVAEVEYANSLDMDVIITDHHTCQEEMPDAVEVINPKRPDCNYPYDMLAGVGIAFKIVQALMSEEEFKANYLNYVDVVAFGTIADIAPLNDENRIIAKFGLQQLTETTNIGLRALIEVSELEGKKITAGHIGFVLAPKINAAGRIGQPELGVELLTTKSEARAKVLAAELAALNKERQEIEANIVAEVDEYIQKNVKLDEKRILVVSGPNWHTGVIGIVASKISEKYYKPTIILDDNGEVAKGSARSVGDFNVFKAMDHCKDLFDKFGGHKQAAGVSLKSENVSAFDEKINAYAFEVMTELDLIPQVSIDYDLSSRDINHDLMDELSLLEPHGVGNSKPSFGYRGLNVDSVKIIGKDRTHLKLLVHDGKRVYDALGFGMAEVYGDINPKEKLDMVIALDKNVFRGVETIQFMINDVRRFGVERFKGEEFFNNYYKSLGNSIICNDIHHNADEDLGNLIQSLERTKADSDASLFTSRLTIVNTMAGLVELMLKEFDAGNVSSVTERIHYGVIDQKRSQDHVILVNPILSNLENMTYDEVIIHDCPPSIGWINYVRDKFPYAKFLKIDENGITIHDKEIGVGIPNKNDLVDSYRCFAKASETVMEMDALLDELRVSRLKLELIFQIFVRLKLMSLKRKGNRVMIKILPKPKEKIDLEDNGVYKRAHFYRYCFSDLSTKYKQLSFY